MRFLTILSLCLLILSSTAKRYEKCELAADLKHKYQMSLEEVKNWVCIAEHESTFNTEAINHSNWDGSKDFGLLQLNNRYWCGDGFGKNVCGLPCEAFLDDDLTDDFKCARKIVKDTERWTKTENGLIAWVAYVNKCQHQNLDTYIEECMEAISTPPRIVTSDPPVPESEKTDPQEGEAQTEEPPTPPRGSGLGQIRPTSPEELTPEKPIKPVFSEDEVKRVEPSSPPPRGSGLGQPIRPTSPEELTPEKSIKPVPPSTKDSGLDLISNTPPENPVKPILPSAIGSEISQLPIVSFEKLASEQPIKLASHPTKGSGLVTPITSEKLSPDPPTKLATDVDDAVPGSESSQKPETKNPVTASLVKLILGDITGISETHSSQKPLFPFFQRVWQIIYKPPAMDEAFLPVNSFSEMPAFDGPASEPLIPESSFVYGPSPHLSFPIGAEPISLGSQYPFYPEVSQEQMLLQSQLSGDYIQNQIPFEALPQDEMQPIFIPDLATSIPGLNTLQESPQANYRPFIFPFTNSANLFPQPVQIPIITIPNIPTITIPQIKPLTIDFSKGITLG